VTNLVHFLTRGLVSQPDAIRVNELAGEASILLELTVAPQDRDAILGPEGDTLRALRTVLSAASGQRKAVLELIQPHSSSNDEE